MSDIKRRLKKAEQKLRINQEQFVVVIRFYDITEFDLSNPVTEWLTYPKALERAAKQSGIIYVSELEEIKARRAAMNQNNGKLINEKY